MSKRRLKQDAARPTVPRTGGRTVERVRVNGVTYALVYTTCGPRCSRCLVGGANYDRDRPGHGPYWYRYVEGGSGKVIRKYCGADLEAYFARRSGGAAAAAEPPAEAGGTAAEPDGGAEGRR